MEKSKSNFTKGLIFAIFSGSIYGTYGFFFTMLLNGGLSTVAVATAGPILIATFFGLKTFIKDRKSFNIGIKNIIIIFIGGGAIIATQHFAAAKALEYVPQSIYTVIEFTHVFLLMVLTSIVFKYKMNAGKIVSLVLALIGLALVLNVFSSDGAMNPLGILWLAINWVTQCLLALLLKKILNDGISSDVALFFYNLGAVIIYSFDCSPVALIGEVMAAPDPLMLAMLILAFGLITQIFGQYCWIKSFSLIDPAITNAMNALAPIVALILGYFILDETVSVIQLVGIAIVIVAVVILNKTTPADET